LVVCPYEEIVLEPEGRRQVAAEQTGECSYPATAAGHAYQAFGNV